MINAKVITLGFEQATQKMRALSLKFAKPERAFKVAANDVVQINDPRFNLKFYGGTVTPKRRQKLALLLTKALQNRESQVSQPFAWGDAWLRPCGCFRLLHADLCRLDGLRLTQ